MSRRTPGNLAQSEIVARRAKKTLHSKEFART